MAFTLRDHRWHNRDLSGVFATIRHSPEEACQAPHGFKQAGWGNTTSGLYNTGNSIRLDSGCTSSEQLDWLMRNKPDYLMTYPSNLASLITSSLDRKIFPSGLKKVLTFGELLPEYLRHFLREAWNVELIDMYSCQEAGTLALQCPEHEHYHVQSENVLLEVLDENNEPCKPGETGKVVVSSLHNYASPLIRYEVGDYAELGEPCPCGRGLTVLKRIYGRARNMLTYPDGNTAWPFLGGAGYYKEVAPIRQFQVIQNQPDSLEFHLVVTPELSQDQQIKLTKRLHETLRYPFNISYHYHDEIKRSAGGKYEDFVSNLVKR